MRTKEEIFNDLKRTKQDHFSTYYNGPPPDLIIIEVMIDIRDNLKELSQVIAADFLDHAKKR